MADGTDAQRELNEITGALDVLFTLREEFATWLEEAQSEERKEELDNVFRHVAARRKNSSGGARPSPRSSPAIEG